MQRLRELGWIEGRTIAIEVRWAEGRNERFAEIAAEFVRLKVDVIVTHSVGVLAAKDATTTIPIVMAIAGDPVATGLVASLARPGGNVTGLSLGTEEGLSGKRLQLLTEAAPKLSRVGVLWNRANPGVASQIADIRSEASILGVRLPLVEFRGSDELEGALTSLAATRSDALIVPTAAAAFQQRARVIAFTARNRLPAIYAQQETVQDGGLMAYASSQIDLWRRAAIYVDKLLKGAKPADLPVEQPTKFELVINLRTAKALGLTIPP